MSSEFVAGFIAGILLSGRTHPVDLEVCEAWLLAWTCAGTRPERFAEHWHDGHGEGFRKLLADNAHLLDDYAENGGGEIGVAELELLEKHLST